MVAGVTAQRPEGLVHIQVAELRDEPLGLLQNLLDDHPLEALAGAVVVPQRRRIRVRWAP